MKITALTNGPFLVEGQPSFTDENGKEYCPQIARKFALCRCGGSLKRPFCDGTHARIGFLSPPQSAPQTPPPSPENETYLAEREGEGASRRDLSRKSSPEP